jgi:hypothetical protein
VTMEVANGIAISGNAVESENASILAIAMAPPAAPEHGKKLRAIERWEPRAFHSGEDGFVELSSYRARSQQTGLAPELIIGRLRRATPSRPSSTP